MKDILIEKIQISEIDETSALLAEAFKANPAYSCIFKNKSRLEEGLRRLFKANLFLHNCKHALTSVIKRKDSGKITGTFTVVPPNGIKNSLTEYAKTGIFGFVSKFGIKPLIRMTKLDGINKSSLEKAIKTSQYYYLSMVAVTEECRGGGIGSYAVKHAVNEIISSNPACKVMGLTTQLPGNVSFYSRLGFKMIDEGYTGLKGEEYYNYNMKLEIS